MKIARFNGWQRIWLVIAVLGLIYAGFHALKNSAKDGITDYEVVAALKDPQCEPIRTLPKGSKLESEPAYGSPCYMLYVENLFSEVPVRTVQEYENKQSKIYKDSLLSWFTASLVMWAIAILLLYAAGAIVAWVRRGFING